MTKQVITTGGFDNLDSKHIRFLHEASKQGKIDILLFNDELIESITGEKSKYPLEERLYFLESVRYVNKVYTINDVSQLEHIDKIIGTKADVWFVQESETDAEFERYSVEQNIEYRMILDEELRGFPEHDYDTSVSSEKKVIVTGCFDWFHSGHVRFLEEVSEYGDLYVIIGHDKNIELLKGSGHPMFSEDERKYMAGSIRFVKQAMISTGHGWLDAEPEILRLKPDRYIVNEDGDKDAKRQYCESHGIEYIVLKREPKAGLQCRTSTDLRGF